LANSGLSDYILPGETHRLQAMLCRYTSQAAKKNNTGKLCLAVWDYQGTIFHKAIFQRRYKTPKKIIFLFFGG
jgi:hypothetical protein